MKRDLEKFVLQPNRKRPPYQVQTLRCPSCDAPLPMFSESSSLILCSHCNSRLNCSAEELTVLGKQNHQIGIFRFQLHQDCTLQGIKYKVIARLRYQDRWKGITRVYLLFHPFHGTRWLSNYMNSFSISDNRRYRSRTLPESFSEGVQIQTEDGSTWICNSESQQILTFVDGALPWIATVNDTSYEVEFEQSGDRNNHLNIEIEPEAKEITYTYSRKISAKEVYTGFGLTESGSIPASPKYVLGLRIIAVCCMLITGLMACWSNREFITTLQFNPADFQYDNDKKSTVFGMVSPSFYLSEEEVLHAIQLEHPGDQYASIEFMKTPTPVEQYESFLEIYTREKDAKESNQTETTPTILTDHYYLPYGSDFIEIFTSIRFPENLTPLISKQRYPTRKVLNVLEPGHYRIWIKHHNFNTKFNIDVAKNIQPTRLYVLSFFISMLALFQTRKL